MNIRDFIRRIIRENVTESGFSRVRRIMRGDVPGLNSVGIVTAENPNSQATSPDENKRRMKQLKLEVRGMGYGFVLMEGQFINREKTLFIPNITRSDLIHLGIQYQQTSVIFGEKMSDEESSYFNFHYIEGDRTIQTRSLSMADKDVQDLPDFFSKVRGRKFVIPFFDDKYDDVPVRSQASPMVNRGQHDGQ
jgi:hypothetical protein